MTNKYSINDSHMNSKRGTKAMGNLTLSNQLIADSAVKGISQWPAGSAALWKTSAAWGTKSAEGFTADWEASAAWGTKSAEGFTANWEASAAWGTKGAEGFTADWEASAAWGTKSAFNSTSSGDWFEAAHCGPISLQDFGVSRIAHA